MFRKLVIIGVFLGLIGATGVQAGEAPAPAANKVENTKTDTAAKKPTIKFSENEFNFGSIRQGTAVEHEFKFKNTGNDVLRIDKVDTSCGCTAAVTSSKEIAPGEEGSIKATFNSGNFMGQIQKVVYVKSNDPDTPQAKLVLTGTVETEVVITPSQIFFGMIEQGQPASRVMNVKQGGQKDLEVTKVECSLPFITAKLNPDPAAPAGKKSYNVEVSINPDAPTGRFEGDLKIYTNLPDYAVIDRKVIGVIKGKNEVPPTAAPSADRSKMTDPRLLLKQPPGVSTPLSAKPPAPNAAPAADNHQAGTASPDPKANH